MVTAGGECLGGLGPFEADSPWWADVGPVVRRLDRELGVRVTVLRLIDVENGEGARDGHVTYHVEAAGRPPDGRLTVVPIDHDSLVAPVAGRATWATREGLQDALSWAGAALRAAGRPPVGAAEQVRTWNLSGLFRIPTAAGMVWLKTTPPFAAREPDVIAAFARIDPSLVPAVVAADVPAGRTLLEHVPGRDCWDPSRTDIETTIRRLVRAQAALAEHPELMPADLPDRTPHALIGLFDRLLDGEAGAELTATELGAARDLAAHLPDLVAELAACGLPLTLVHGDFHPGNWRSDSQAAVGVAASVGAGSGAGVAVDFADSHFGHPALDGLRPREFLPDDRWEHVADVWATTWSQCRPGSDPRRALTLAAPLGHISYAVRYQEFLDNIEVSERLYHLGDPAHTIRAALSALR
ncbi:aminoglycoside phosphotransferase family protein [Parafrankia sp. EUN1f]|uniref:aminoglycoside phosphotransferase family protein n=1 Tax=Parafrankia sp. EUN1f TaxID=102897 RepID=UPI0001C442BB|nr:aminoglycoside phosphotransferase family protein [Parafrankia sp. EUN1f]EFC85160.1 aminoglycoside phosphotransferase [Parafrankia sp. EUN1f]